SSRGKRDRRTYAFVARAPSPAKTARTGFGHRPKHTLCFCDLLKAHTPFCHSEGARPEFARKSRPKNLCICGAGALARERLPWKASSFSPAISPNHLCAVAVESLRATPLTPRLSTRSIRLLL